MTDSIDFENVQEYQKKILCLYSIMTVVSPVLMIILSSAHIYCSLKSARRLHKSLLHSVLHTSMEFFDSHYMGNILNRFSNDIYFSDAEVHFNLFNFVKCLLKAIGIIILITIVNRSFLFFFAVLFMVLYLIRKVYISSGRCIRRLQSATRSPIVGHINATFEGLSTIRASRKEEIVKKEFDRHQDLHSSSYYMNICTAKAFGFYLETLNNLFAVSLILFFLFIDRDASAGNVGLALSQAFTMIGIVGVALQIMSEAENLMTCIERILDYSSTKTESNSGLSLSDWPTNGQICYKNVNLSYNSHTKEILKDLNFLVERHQKVAIVGRTGAGKSSIVASLFRLYEMDGNITIDDVDIKTLSLNFLRSKITIIPQDPVLFSGSIRTNIDPLNRYSDSDIWKTVEKINLNYTIDSLDSQITGGGSNFSSGERQLICLIRALISQNKIIVLDEATANMDQEMDEALQQVIDENLKECTVLTVVHRFHNIERYDKVMVVDDGQILEYDVPRKLLEDKDSYFYKLFKDAKV